MTTEHDNALAIAKLVGELKAVRAETEALGERVETKQAEYRTDIARLAEQSALRDKEAAQRESRLAEQSAQRESRLAEQSALRDKEAAQRESRLAEQSAQRDKDNLRWTVGFGIAQIAITVAIIGGGVTILGLLIGLPTN